MEVSQKGTILLVAYAVYALGVLFLVDVPTCNPGYGCYPPQVSYIVSLLVYPAALIIVAFLVLILTSRLRRK